MLVCAFQKIKRNLNGEITCIFIIALNKRGSRCKYDIDSDKQLHLPKFNLKKRIKRWYWRFYFFVKIIQLQVMKMMTYFQTI
jgi:hypothetical protein